MLGNVACFMSSADFFQIYTFSKKYFSNTIRVSDSLDPDQARHIVGPDLGTNCLQRLSADDCQQTTKDVAGRLRIKAITLKACCYGNRI